jgi:serine/threonine protein kinase
MGIVYRARDLRLARDVALKVLSPELVADPDERARLVREAQAAAALEHPHIAVVHDVDEADGLDFIVMEYVQGESLSSVLARGSMKVGRALDLAVEIADALVCAHSRGTVHRDLKPANVMITAEGHAKIIDFGLARVIEAREAVGASYGSEDLGIVGTVAYMPSISRPSETGLWRCGGSTPPTGRQNA